MYCNQCGTQNPDTAMFCLRCGRPIETRRGAGLHPPSSQPPRRIAFINTIKQQKNRGYVIAIVGAVLALFAFSFLPFATYLIPDGDFELGIIWYNATSLSAANFDQFTQLSGMLTFITLLLAVLLTFRTNPFGMAKTSIDMQRRRTMYAMLGMSGLSILIYLGEVINNSISYVGFSSVGLGFWLYLLGVGIVIIGSIVALRTRSSSLPPQAQREWQPPPTQLPPR